MNSIVLPVVDLSMRQLCCRPYPNHKKGCPNYGKKPGCPPQCQTIDKMLDLDKPVYAIYNKYDFGGHVERMREKHPGWSQRQLKCCLYWQGTARKCLREIVKKFIVRHPHVTIVRCPEAAGVNLTATMKQIGVSLEWPPQKHTYQIVLAGDKL